MAWGGLAAGWPMLRLQPRRYDGRSTMARLVDGSMIVLSLLLPRATPHEPTTAEVVESTEAIAEVV